MDLKRLAVVLSQRLAPVYIAVALSWVTGYFIFTIGGIGLAIALELAWPLLRPFCEVLYEELTAQHSQAQAQRRTALLKAFLPFFQAYKTVLTTYPHVMLMASASEVATQIETFAEAIHDVKARRGPEPDDPFAPPGEDAYEIVRTVSLTPRDFRDWSLKDCQTWRQDLLAVLAKGRIAALRHAVQHCMHERPREVWEPCLAETTRDLEREAEHTLSHWPCLQRAHADPAVRERLTTFLNLDSINRQAGIQAYLTTHLQCPPAEIHNIMASIRYDAVAAKLLALMPTQDEPLALPESRRGDHAAGASAPQLPTTLSG
jgi:hypothetical protein